LKGYLYAALRKFYFLKCICPLPVFKSIYYSIVDSKLQYGISCWGGPYFSTNRPLTICQNKIIKSIYGARKRDSSFPLYWELSILPLRYIYIYRVLRIFYVRGGHLQGNYNVYSRRLQLLNRVQLPFPKTEAFRRFYTYFVLCNEIHNYATRQRQNIFIESNHYSRTLKSFGVTAVKLYNALPVEIRKLNVGNFKLKIKDFLLVNPIYSYEEFFKLDLFKI